MSSRRKKFVYGSLRKQKAEMYDKVYGRRSTIPYVLDTVNLGPKFDDNLSVLNKDHEPYAKLNREHRY
jgi:hypothetical protein